MLAVVPDGSGSGSSSCGAVHQNGVHSDSGMAFSASTGRPDGHGVLPVDRDLRVSSTSLAVGADASSCIVGCCGISSKTVQSIGASSWL